MLVLHNQARERDNIQIEFLASIHGAEIDQKQTPQKKREVKKKEEKFLFPHPDEVAKMSDEEKKSKTQAMLKHWQGVFKEESVVPPTGVIKR